MVYLASPLELELHLSDKQFVDLCHRHGDLQFERNAKGDLIIMPPTGGLTGDRNADLTYQLRAWNRNYKLGKVFDSSTGFKLPNQADRSPDASFVTINRWNSLTPEQQDKYLPFCPDFVAELRSPTDSLTRLETKMQEYLENGAKLGWLIDPITKIVKIYRPEQAVEILQSPTTVSGEDVLPNFVLNLAEIF